MCADQIACLSKVTQRYCAASCQPLTIKIPSTGNIASADHNRTKKTPRDSCKDPKVSCPICEERQRRPLATYIRTKSRQDRKEDQSIPEDDGENVEAAASDNGQKSEARVTPQQTPAAK
jgi:hypothetical protein